MFQGSLVLIITAVLLKCGHALVVELSLGTCYIFHGNFYANEDKRYIVAWTGGSVSSSCKVKFHGYDKNGASNEYKVCIRPITWVVPDPSVKLKYYSDKEVLKDTLKRTYDNNTEPTEWCSEPDDYVRVQLIAHSNQLFSPFPLGEIRLEVTGVMTYNYYKTVYWALGGSVGGLVLIVLISVLVVWICCRKSKGRNGKVIGNSSKNGTSTQL